MTTLLRLVLGLLLVGTGLLGCVTAPIRDVENVPIRMQRADYTLDDVGKAITRAGTFTSWQMETIRPGFIMAIYARPDYSAAVTITFTRTAYSIKYHNSRNLDYQEGGEIHENYNVWVSDLDDAIRRELAIE